jgi:hypothetical protein
MTITIVDSDQSLGISLHDHIIVPRHINASSGTSRLQCSFSSSTGASPFHRLLHHPSLQTTFTGVFVVHLSEQILLPA